VVFVLKLVVLALGGAVPAGVLAQTSEAPSLPPWATWGVLGLVITGFVTKQLVPGWLYADIKTENKEQKVEINRLVDLALETQKATLPAIQASTSAVGEALAEIRTYRKTNSGTT
jgi:hypothetical protein